MAVKNKKKCKEQLRKPKWRKCADENYWDMREEVMLERAGSSFLVKVTYATKITAVRI
jgi:hypothetical protein